MSNQNVGSGEGTSGETSGNRKVYSKKWIGQVSVENDRQVRTTDQSSSMDKKSKCSCRTSVCCANFWLFGFGGFIALIGILLSILWPLLTSKILATELAINEGSYMFDKWVQTPIPMYQKFYMFNWTNPEATLRNEETPAFAEMGPYVFTLKYIKKNITWNGNNTVTYFYDRLYHFVPELSNGNLTDLVTNFNVVAMTVGWACKDLSEIEKMIVNSFLSAEEHTVIKTDTVINLLLAGSDDPLLTIAHKLRWILSKIKKLPQMDKFAFFYQKNMTLTADGVFTMNTGEDNIENVGLQTAWDYSSQTVFPGECGVVRGSFGDEFPPNSTTGEQIFIFANDLCSVLPLTKNNSYSVLDVPTVTFVSRNDTFSNSTSCYCTESSCPASGARDVSACQGAPIFMSWPHFYLAGPTYRTAVQGMKPDPDIHEFRMGLAEVTGVPMLVRARIQINLQIEPIEHMSLFKDLPTVMLPMVWFSQEADMTSDIASELMWAARAVDYGRWWALSAGLLGVVLIGVGVVLHCAGCFRRQPSTDRRRRRT